MKSIKKYPAGKAAKTKLSAKSVIAITTWVLTLGTLHKLENLEEKTNGVAASAKFEEFDNRKQNADDDIPQHLHHHHQIQEQPRQVQEDCRGGVHGESRH